MYTLEWRNQIPTVLFFFILDRWDNPLHQLYFEEEPLYEDIYLSLFEGKRPRDPVSAKPEQPFDSNFLYELDSTCQEIINEILGQQANNIVECVKITEENYIYLKKIFSAVELKKLKQEYIKISKMHPPKNKADIIKTFVQYINTVQDRY
jgi:tRNA uridine 5-carbamoylmethylation protein Kti12